MQFTEWRNGNHYDYVAKADGTFYMNAGPGGKATMTQKVSSAYISQLFERSGIDSDTNISIEQFFAAVNIAEEQLTVTIYHALNTVAAVTEGFGIDKAVPRVSAQIANANGEAAVKAARKS